VLTSFTNPYPTVFARHVGFVLDRLVFLQVGQRGVAVVATFTPVTVWTRDRIGATATVMAYECALDHSIEFVVPDVVEMHDPGTVPHCATDVDVYKCILNVYVLLLMFTRFTNHSPAIFAPHVR